SCGALFVEEEAPTQFECPLCKAMVDMSATSCPSCGALFVEEGEEAGPAPTPPDVGVEPAPEAPEEALPVPSAPVSETPVVTPPAPEPTSAPAKNGKPVSFMEKMRKMREASEEEAVKPSSPAETGPPVSPPTPAPKPTPVAAPPAPVPGEKTKRPVCRAKKKVVKKAKPTPPPAEPVAPVEPVPEPAPVKPKSAPVAPKALPSPKERYKELASLVEEVKPLLFEARRMGLDVGRMKGLIAQAIAAGREKDYDKAILLVKESRDSTGSSISNRISALMKELRGKRNTAKKTGADVSKIDQMVARAQDSLKRKDYSNAYNIVHQAMEQIPAAPAGESAPVPEPAPIADIAPDSPPKAAPVPSGPVSPAVAVKAGTLHLIEETIARAAYLGFEVKDIDKMVEKASVLVKEGKHKEAEPYIRNVQGFINSEIPGMVAEFMAGAKSLLIESKMLGKDITKAIGLVKEAKVAAKKEDYSQALEYLAAFRKEI
ncbi:MAG: hypothetical protein KAT70_02090, partial [Thermoplasmata archaeon]|nr:hypothetical protein [Thermoplasmata archaeon]